MKLTLIETIRQSIESKTTEIGNLENQFNPEILETLNEAIATAKATKGKMLAMRKDAAEIKKLSERISLLESDAENELLRTESITGMIIIALEELEELKADEKAHKLELVRLYEVQLGKVYFKALCAFLTVFREAKTFAVIAEQNGLEDCIFTSDDLEIPAVYLPCDKPVPYYHGVLLLQGDYTIEPSKDDYLRMSQKMGL